MHNFCMEGFQRTDSWMSSKASASESWTRASSPQFAQQEQVPSLDSLVTESTSTEWTDEKHGLYLKSMEASFVNQLYDSIDLPGSKLSKLTSSGQIKVLRGGCWKKIDFERPRFRVHKRDHSSCFMASPCIQQFELGLKSRAFAASCTHLQVNGSSKEESDQNFVDEEQGEKGISKCSSKRLKTLAADASCNEQVIL